MGAPLLLLFLLVIASVSRQEANPIPTLLALKRGLEDPDGNLLNWEPTSSPCKWSGIMCESIDGTSTVVGLDLSGMNLSGLISSDIIALDRLQVLNISRNKFTGPFQGGLFFGISSLKTLDISYNSFNGTLEMAVGTLSNLVSFSAFSNDFAGPLPRVPPNHFPSLRRLDLGGSYFASPIPPAYGSLSQLKYLDLSGNSLSGSIPSELGELSNLLVLKLGWNYYSGGIPDSFGNLSSLELLDIAGANLSGGIPATLSKLDRLHTLFLYNNSLSSAIPPEMAAMRSLMSLDLSENKLIGVIPDSFKSLTNLTLLSLMYNGLSGAIPSGLARLPKLETFLGWNNQFSGGLPQEFGRFSPLAWLDVSANGLEGSIPSGLCEGGKLFKLMLFSNKFSGSIPTRLAECTSLRRLRLEDNKLTGPIPKGFGQLENLVYLDISRNSLEGGIPRELGNASGVQFLDLSSNPLGGAIPEELWLMRSLQKLNTSSCQLSSTVSISTYCPPLLSIDLSNNYLSGAIPDAFSLCRKLNLLRISWNNLSSRIPIPLAGLPVLAILDLSHNYLSGEIPYQFQNSTSLDTFDVSYNNLSGPVPSQGLFKFLNPSFLDGNPGLCGNGVIWSCNSAVNPSPNPRQKLSRPLTWLIVSAIFLIAFLILVTGMHCLYNRYKLHLCGISRQSNGEDGGGEGPWNLIAFQKLSFNVDEITRCLNGSNIVGMGASGTVYKAEMPNGELIAVKKLWRSEKETNTKGGEMLSEVDVLGSVRHRNIVRLLGYCMNKETTLLLYEFMPNGSLGDLLHGNKEATNALLANWITRYNIAMGVAQGLCYLHHDCFPIVLHRDVKSNNILLDMNMEARVADFGVAKLLESNSTEAMSSIAGSYGYIAPEYAYTLQVNEKSDIYSFGVVLLELLTGKRPVEPEFGESANIVEWVRRKIETSDGILEVLDANIAGSLRWLREEMSLVLRVALLCTSKLPTDRPSMRDVVTMLLEAKPQRKSTLNKEFLSLAS